MSGNFDQKMERLITGESRYHSSNLGLNLLLSRVQKKYSVSQTQDELSECLQEVKVFFDKYQKIMVRDVTAIENL